MCYNRIYFSNITFERTTDIEACSYLRNNSKTIFTEERGMKKHGIFGFDKQKKSHGSRFDASPFNPETHYAVIRSSICTGEKVAGFKDKRDGRFTEVMLIRTPKDEQEFKERYNVDSLRTEY